MQALFHFAIWAGLFFLMMRLCGGARIMGHGHTQPQSETGNQDKPELRWMPPKKDTDPVCGKTVTTDKAKPSVYAGNVYYFCSRDCREVFEAAPALYVGDSDPNQPKLEHSHA